MGRKYREHRPSLASGREPRGRTLELEVMLQKSGWLLSCLGKTTLVWCDPLLRAHKQDRVHRLVRWGWGDGRMWVRLQSFPEAA